MTKRAFLKQFAALGMASPFAATLLSSCFNHKAFYEDIDATFEGRIVIVGAGAAGLTAAHILSQQGIEFQVVEASARHGGRVKKTVDFVDFPIDLGGEWIHTNPSVLAKLKNDRSATQQIDLVTYNPKTITVWKNGELKNRNIASNFYSEYKFKSTTWFDFFEEHMVPGFSDKIIYNSPVVNIDYSGSEVILTTQNGTTIQADKVLVTVPISILQDDFITFTPALPEEKITEINKEEMPDGLKVFVEFSEKFYPDILTIDSLLRALLDSDHLYYDAAFGKEAKGHVLGLFTVGEKASRYISLGSDEAILAEVMRELDTIFEGKASRCYRDHRIQNWSQEPFIRGSYSHGLSAPEVLAAPVHNRLFFAGEAVVTNGNTATVHGAAESAFEAIKKMLVDA